MGGDMSQRLYSVIIILSLVAASCISAPAAKPTPALSTSVAKTEPRETEKARMGGGETTQGIGVGVGSEPGMGFGDPGVTEGLQQGLGQGRDYKKLMQMMGRNEGVNAAKGFTPDFGY